MKERLERWKNKRKRERERKSEGGPSDSAASLFFLSFLSFSVSQGSLLGTQKLDETP